MDRYDIFSAKTHSIFYFFTQIIARFLHSPAGAKLLLKDLHQYPAVKQQNCRADGLPYDSFNLFFVIISSPPPSANLSKGLK